MIDTHALELIGEAIKQIGLRVRVKASFDESVSSWTTVLGFPSPGYIEPGGVGPVTLKQLNWIDIDPVKVIDRGMRLTPKQEDKTVELTDFLRKHEITFMLVDGVIRVEITI